MCIYCNTTNYRKIYENHYGTIPKEKDGRNYEIHHIDGNHSNNDPNNLVALTIQEHHNIHYSQGDWAACLLISRAMNLSPEEKSELARKSALERIENGSHHFAGKKGSVHSKKVQKKRIDAGTHHLLGGEVQRKNNNKRVKEGAHHFLTGDIARNMVKNGTHPFAGERGSVHSKKVQKKRIDAGTHHLLGPVGETHPTQKHWCCEHCNKEGKGESNYSRWHGDNCRFK